ncbi:MULTISPECIES: YtxH domain-containing protein [Oceanobacillus]|jgi:gas vesicle protein|uniref:YtxH domain-containing protein n=1 Tax=Oceanobacillus TaxID=182709 RepID=UPI000BA7B839|nr:YtxH domain-containing protein [Oceanobacillus profundus]MBR3119892.1 YtxH domain-containing protein [Oceanobacillus sp.]MCM3397650.1 YtxH domain-containing protein [Oceanobacillus profundus]PAE27721.1 hypothetical protein CHI07_18280 [Paenibacillus sp. 7884-2]
MTEQNKQDTQKNSKESDKVYTKKDVIRGGIIGWGIGVATTLLLAPKSGKELRGDITYQVGSAKDKAVDKSREISDSAMDKYAAIKENATNKTIELKDKLNPAKNTSSNEAKLDEEDPKNNSESQSNRTKEKQNPKDEQKDKQNPSASSNKKTEANSKAGSSSARRTAAKRSSGTTPKTRAKTASASK